MEADANANTGAADATVEADAGAAAADSDEVDDDAIEGGAGGPIDVAGTIAVDAAAPNSVAADAKESPPIKNSPCHG